MKKIKTLIRPADILIITVLLALCAAATVSFGTLNGNTAEIITDRELLYSIDLSQVKEPYTITLDCGAVILVEKDAIGFCDSDCNNKLCVNTGMLKKAGQSAACIPNKTVIRITGRQKTQFDAITK